MFEMKRISLLMFLLILISIEIIAQEKTPATEAPKVVVKVSATKALADLKAGNERYVADKLANPHCTQNRRDLGAKEGQAKFASATILTCSDSRVPPEHIFDAGVMDLFVIRVAGNPANVDEIASIEYGLAHVNTPVLVIMGHTKCGAVTAAVGMLEPKKEGAHEHGLEANIAPLVNGLTPAVMSVKKNNPEAKDQVLIDLCIEENVWFAVENLLKKSEITRKKILDGSVILAPAIYDIATGKINWLKEAKVYYYIGKIEEQQIKKVEVAPAVKTNTETSHAMPESKPMTAEVKSVATEVKPTMPEVKSAMPEIKVSVPEVKPIKPEAKPSPKSEGHH
jgi:carbonic anhydrase